MIAGKRPPRSGWHWCCAALLLLAGCNADATKPAPTKPPEVTTDYPHTETVTEYEETPGRLAGIKTVEIRSRVSGYLDKVHFKDGADVKAGQELFDIDPRPFEAEQARAAATLAQTQAHLERMRRQDERAKKLLASRAMSPEDYDTAAFDRAEAQAAMAAAAATLRLADLNLKFTKIAAPVDGRISRRLVDPGNMVKADDTPLVTIISLNPIYAYFGVDERTALKFQRLVNSGKIKSARESPIVVDLALADDAGYTLQGTIDFVDNQFEAGTGTLLLRVVIDNSSGLLAPGLFVRLRVPIGEPHEALLVREEALGSDQGQRFVYVVNDKDEVSYRRVKIGNMHAGNRVILDGLKPRERVIVNGLQRVRPGIKVAPKPIESPVSVASKIEDGKTSSSPAVTAPAGAIAGATAGGAK